MSHSHSNLQISLQISPFASVHSLRSRNRPKDSNEEPSDWKIFRIRSEVRRGIHDASIIVQELIRTVPENLEGFRHRSSPGRIVPEVSRIIYRLSGGQRELPSVQPGCRSRMDWLCTFVKHYSRGCSARTLAAQAPIVPAGYADRIVLCLSRLDFSSRAAVFATCAPSMCTRGTPPCTRDRECAHQDCGRAGEDRRTGWRRHVASGRVGMIIFGSLFDRTEISARVTVRDECSCSHKRIRRSVKIVSRFE